MTFGPAAASLISSVLPASVKSAPGHTGKTSTPASRFCRERDKTVLSTLEFIRPLLFWDRKDPATLDHVKPCWYWDKKDLAHTPSQSEGLDPATEARYRREGARFIFDVGTRLGLYPSVASTVITHREALCPPLLLLNTKHLNLLSHGGPNQGSTDYYHIPRIGMFPINRHL